MDSIKMARLETDIRKGNYTRARRLSREERVELVRGVAVWNTSRALTLSILFMSNFKTNNR